MSNLFFELLTAHAPLWAGRILALGTVVIGVVEEVGLLHLFNRGLATRAGVFATVGELETAVSAHELVLLFSGDHAVALSAADEPCEWEYAVCTGAWVAVAAQKRLRAIVFGLRHHRLVVAFVPPVAPSWVLKPAVVERLCEKIIDRTTGYFFATLFPGGPGAKAPLVVGDCKNLRWGV